MAVVEDPPVMLGPAGRAFWDEIMGAYELRADERVLLVQACQTMDVIADLERVIDAARAHGVVPPAKVLTELRGHRVTLIRLVRALELPDPADAQPTAAQRLRSARARDVVDARWHRG